MKRILLALIVVVLAFSCKEEARKTCRVGRHVPVSGINAVLSVDLKNSEVS